MPENPRDALRLLENQVEDLPNGSRKFLSLSDAMRKFTTTGLVIAYGLALALAMTVFIFQGFGAGCGSTKDGGALGCAWDQAAANALELIKIGVMPVITLVIGYYFGKASD